MGMDFHQIAVDRSLDYQDRMAGDYQVSDELIMTAAIATPVLCAIAFIVYVVRLLAGLFV